MCYLREILISKNCIKVLLLFKIGRNVNLRIHIEAGVIKNSEPYENMQGTPLRIGHTWTLIIAKFVSVSKLKSYCSKAQLFPTFLMMSKINIPYVCQPHMLCKWSNKVKPVCGCHFHQNTIG